MELRRLTGSIFVAPQISIDDIAQAAKAGFTTVIDNRPDREISADLHSGRVAEAAAAAGLSFHYLPIEPGQFSEILIHDFATALDQSRGPVLAYCRSGTRCATIWALSQSGRRPVDEILRITADAGYDLSGISSYLD